MNSAEYVGNLIKSLKEQGNVLSEVAWKAALACVGWPYVFGARGQYCTPANRRARYSDAHPTIKSKCKNFDGSDMTGCAGCKWYPNSKYTRIYDCRGFTYWILKQVYGWELEGAGCTSQWNKASNWKAKGEISDGIPQGVIVCVFYFKKDSKGRRTTTVEHTGLYYNGETVECSNGVQHSKSLNKKWEVWGLPACVEAEGEIAPVPVPSVPEEPKDEYPTLRKGSKGDWVKILQNKLMMRGFALPRFGADGDFGSETLTAVKAFQMANGLTEDGVVGRLTWEKLNAEQKEPLYSVTVSNVPKAIAEEIVQKYGGVITQ